MSQRSSRSFLFLAALAMPGAVASCGSDAAAPVSTEPSVFAMRLTVAGAQLTVDATGSITGTSNAVLRTGVSSSVSAIFTDRSGVPVATVTPGAFRLAADIIGADATFTPDSANALSGSMVVLAPLGSLHVRFSLYHVTTQRTTWGPFDVVFSAPY